MVTLTIDKKVISVPEGTTILEAARSANISIPTLCYLKDVNEIAACRICMVEVEGHARLVPSCDNAVVEGMVVHTNSPRVREARRVNLRLILSQHEICCTKCTRSGSCKLQTLCNDYNLLGDHYIKDLKNIPTDFSNPVVRIENRCIRCMRCIQVCEKIQTMNIWDVVGTGTRTTVGVGRFHTLGESDCTFCGQCITHCPVGALQEHDDTGKVWDALADPNRITVVQIAPAVRAAWAEYYHLDPKFATAKRMVTALKEIGFDYVFDTNFTADLTIMEEGTEFLQRFTHRDQYKWPMFTSCCPGWVRFVKGQFPEYTTNLSTAKSPQAMFGAVAKSYFAEKIGVDPKKLRVISVMPCTSKKSEAALPTMKDACGDPDVDVVITPRELVRMLSERYGRVFIHGGGGAEQAFAEEMERTYPNVTALYGKVRFAGEMDLIANLDCVVTMDSLVMHLASLVATPVVSVWGATHPGLGFLGYGVSSGNVLQADMACRPCSVFGNKPCRYGDYRCLKAVTPEMAARRVAEITGSLPECSGNG